MTLRRTSLRPLFVVAMTLVTLVGAQSAAGQAEEEYIPFVTDFGGATSASEGEYIPFVTDFPRSPVEPTPVSTPVPGPRETPATESGFDWAAAGIGAGAALALVAFALGTGLAVRGRARVVGA